MAGALAGPAAEPILVARRLRAGHGRGPGASDPDPGPRQEPARSAFTVLSDVSLTVRAGDVVAVLGASGSGKTTLLRVLAGVHPRWGGELTVAGRALAPGQVAFPDVGLARSFPERQFFASTVLSEVAFGAQGAHDRAGDRARDQARDQARAALATMGFAGDRGIEDRGPWQLSAGEQRRVAIASVLVFAPRLLLLDEPVAGLDVRGRADLAAAVSRIASRGGGIVLAGHDLEWITPVVSRVLILDGGRLVERTHRGDRGAGAGLPVPGPGEWRFFESRVPEFWRSGAWRRPPGVLARFVRRIARARKP